MARKKILIADDEHALRLLVTSTLEDERFQLFEAFDGMDAVTKAGAEHPDIVILDLMMPKMSGIDVCRRLRNLVGFESVTIIVLSAKGQEADVREAIAAGANHYLRKPFSPLQLIELIEQITSEGHVVR